MSLVSCTQRPQTSTKGRSMNDESGINLSGKDVQSDPAMEKVISLQSRIQELERRAQAYKKDRDQILGEFTDLRNARKVQSSPIKKRSKAGNSKTRVCVGDVHGMRQDPKAVAAFLSDLAVIDPDEVVLGGDIAECGGWLAKHQPIGFVANLDYSYQEDMQAANDFLDSIQTCAPHAKIYYIEGNHEDRVERWAVDQTMAHERDAEFLVEAFSPRSVLRLEERGIEYYKRTVTHVDDAPRGWIKLDDMFFTHTLGRGKNAARSALEKTAANVTYFCTHREDTATMVLPGVGLVKAYNPGCLCTMQPVWKNSDPTTWSQGYGIDFVEDGVSHRVHVPIWKGVSRGQAMLARFK